MQRLEGRIPISEAALKMGSVNSVKIFSKIQLPKAPRTIWANISPWIWDPTEAGGVKHLPGGAREEQESSKLCIHVLNNAVPWCEAVCQQVSKCFIAWLLMISDIK